MGDAIVRVIIRRMANESEFGKVVVKRGGRVRKVWSERWFFVIGRTYQSFRFKREKMVTKLDQEVQRNYSFGVARRGSVTRRVHENYRGEE